LVSTAGVEAGARGFLMLIRLLTVTAVTSAADELLGAI
jgi:hypothetical protein